MGTTPDRQYGRELATEPEVAARVAAHADGTLLHDIDRAAVMTIVRDLAGHIQFLRYRDGMDGPVLRETEVARDMNGRTTTITDRQYEPPGTLARTRVLVLRRDANGRVAGGSVAVI